MTLEEFRIKLTYRFELASWKDFLGKMFSKIDYFTKPVTIDHRLIKSGGQIGFIHLDDGHSLALFCFEVADCIHISRNRKGLRDIAATYIDMSLFQGVWAFYYSPNQEDYRLTYIAKQFSFTPEGKFTPAETAPKRFTFLLGPNEMCTTAAHRLYELMQSKSTGGVNLTNITECFSVERLNKEFFNGYKTQYKKFLALLDEDKKDNRDYVKKLLGRLVFLHFLQKKGWMGIPADRKEWSGGDPNYLYNLVKRHANNNHLLTDVFEVLFFDTLNKKRDHDRADTVLGENIRIPYLNGGLFDKDRLDNFDIDFPYPYFSELMEFFSMYNFTIDENEPEDAEIGIDPEMLGHIFENLLEDNKDKGVYYTPKEIVQYMCRESMIQYLKTYTAEELHPAVERLVNQHTVDLAFQKEEHILRLINLLRTIKVCDPAIGSGAFPMGILNVLYHIRHLLSGFIKKDKQGFIPAKVKREIIQNNIFGVDCEQGAVDIARLRFWLALVVDETDPLPLPNLDYKIMCGDSLISRFSLDIPFENVLENSNKENNTPYTLEDYKQWVYDYTNESDHDRKDIFRKKIEQIKQAFKTELNKKEISKIISKKRQIADLEAPRLFDKLTKAEEHTLSIYRKELQNLLQQKADIESNKLYESSFEWRFEFPQLLNEQGDFTGFDIVIGNPPYLRIQGIRAVNPAIANELTKKYVAATGSFDLYVCFVERGLHIIGKNGIVNYIMPVKWTNAAFGKGLRSVVCQEQAAYKIINFGAYQVFNASTYTGLQWFKHESKALYYTELNKNLNTNHDLATFLNSLAEHKMSKINQDKLDGMSWTLTTGITTDILNKLEDHPRNIGSVFYKIFQGLATSKDDVYFLYDCSVINNQVTGYSKYLQTMITIEKDLVKPLLKGEDVHRYDTIKTTRFVIFPYKLQADKAILYTEKEIADLFPQGYLYLKECEEVLRGREKGRFNIDGEWFQFGRKQGILFAESEKLVAPDISMGGNYAYDKKGTFYQTTTIYGYIKKENIKESYKCLMAFLNSRLCWWYLTNTGTTLANGFFRFKPDYIKPFPIPAENVIAKAQPLLEKLVDCLEYLYNPQHEAIYNHTSNERLQTHFNEMLDMIIYELYFSEHMKQQGIEVIDYALSHSPLTKAYANVQELVESTYDWYQTSENLIRQSILLLETRSKNFLYYIHLNAIL